MKYSREQLEALLSAYLDNELTGVEGAEVEAYLRKDAAARTLLADLQAMRAAMQALPRAKASADMMESIRARMERQALLGEAPETSVRRSNPRLAVAGRWAAAAMIVVMTSVGGYVIWNLNAQKSVGTANQQLVSADKPTSEMSLSEGRPEADGVTAKGTQSSPPTETLALANADRRESPEINSALGHETARPAAPAVPAAAPLASEAGRPRSEWADKRSSIDQTPARRELAEGGVYLARRSTPALALRAARPGSAAGGQAFWARGRHEGADPVVTLNCADVESKRKLIGQVSAGAISIAPLGTQDHVLYATTSSGNSTASYGVKSMPSDGRARGFGYYEQPVEQERTGGTALAKERAYSSESKPEAVMLGDMVQDQVTDLLVVVANDKAREEMLRRLGLAGEPVAAPDQTLESLQESAWQSKDESTPPPAMPSQLPEDSIVNAGGAGLRQPAEDLARGESTDALTYDYKTEQDAARPQSRESDGDFAPVPNMPAAAPKVSTTPAQAVAAVEMPHVLRLHIKVQEPTTRPVEDLLTTPASTPVDSIPFNPSVLDLGKRPKKATQPASRPVSTRP